ncbi:SDR family oxidoreductase [Leptolyngbya sp. PCC 6406]|uniref:SDR family oxidoreductase n=1 Tax=Leptolyngbya sp. PCC 6406 TaxID=1173264 RepID=UPI0002AC461D|nr:SDR family oxidoreductase [Leptolyngbya sp. PCC 6406]
MTSDTRQQALVTGASSGIGRATAMALAQTGTDLVLVGRSLDKLENLAQDLKTTGVKVHYRALDLADLAPLSSTLAAIIADCGPIDLLINSAGMGYTGSLAEMPLEEWQQVLNLNLTSVLLCMQAVLPGMRDRGGTIVNIASVAAYNAFPDWGAYSVSKAGLVTLSRIFAAEERSHGVRVIVIAPGSVNTPLWDAKTVQADFPRSQMLSPETVAQAIISAVQIPASAVVEELKLMPSGGAF